jgi:hypothetical protein
VVPIIQILNLRVASRAAVGFSTHKLFWGGKWGSTAPQRACGKQGCKQGVDY